MSDLAGVKTSLVFLNTKDCCFFCLKQIDKEDHEDSETGSCLFSLQKLCSYLNITLNGESKVSKELKKLFGIQDATFGKDSGGDEAMEIEVSTCFSCKVLGKRLSGLFLELERIKLQVDNLLNYMGSEMPKSSSMGGVAVGVLQGFYQRMESDEDSKAHLKIVDCLRREILDKCLARHTNVKSLRGIETVKKTSFPDKEGETDAGGGKSSKGIMAGEAFLTSLLEPSPPPHSDEAEEDSSFDDHADESVTNAQRKLDSEYDEAVIRGKRKDSPTAKEFQCSKCDKSYGSLYHLKRHFNSVHLKKRYKCDVCNEAVFSQPYRLSAHKKKCHEMIQGPLKTEKKRKLVCDWCEKRFDSKESLQRHRVRVHESADRYPCDLCEKKFKKSDHLKRHKDAVHLGKTFSCRFCKRKFTRQYVMRGHEGNCLEKPRIKTEQQDSD